MRTFKDSCGNDWSVNVNVATVMRIKQETDKMLPAIFDDNCKLLGELSQDYFTLARILYICCAVECEARGMLPEQFPERLAGDSLAQAMEALWRSTADFFMYPEARASAHRAIDLINETVTKSLAMMDQKSKQAAENADTSILADEYSRFVMNGRGSPELTQGGLQPAS